MRFLCFRICPSPRAFARIMVDPVGYGTAILTGSTSNCTVLGTNILFEDTRDRQTPSLSFFNHKEY
jgi:hypothetical protein